jgi:putative peptidoglycan lipid II flippase
MIMLAVAYCRRKELAPHGIVKFLLKAALSVAVMAVLIYVMDRFLPAQGGKLAQLSIIAIKGIVAVAIYFAMAVILRMEEATYWIDRFKRILKRGSSKKTAV